MIFDGVDDYVKLPILNLPEKFSISFWARWDALYYYSRIYDFSNGKCGNNIDLTNYLSDDL